MCVLLDGAPRMLSPLWFPLKRQSKTGAAPQKAQPHLNSLGKRGRRGAVLAKPIGAACRSLHSLLFGSTTLPGLDCGSQRPSPQQIRHLPGLMITGACYKTEALMASPIFCVESSNRHLLRVLFLPCLGKPKGKPIMFEVPRYF